MNRAGCKKQNLSGEMAYHSFVPSPLPPNPALNVSAEMINLLLVACEKLSALENVAVRIPNVNLFVSMYVRKESLLSSQIEGTQATLEDIFDPSRDENITHDVKDVVNYIKATEYAIDRLNSLPLCNRLLTETHAVLMKDVRGQEKCPGEFRRSQNWIGGRGCSLAQARYIPPSCEDMQQSMSDLEKFINSEDDSLHPLLRIALIHYQFETIHPFLDGNGRIGRLLIGLFLKEQKILTLPVLYISYYLKKNRVEYYDRMSEVRRSGNYEQWVSFFLRAIIDTAADALQTIDALTALHERNMNLISQLGRKAKSAGKLFAHLETRPIIDIVGTAKIMGCSYNTLMSSVKELQTLGIITQTNNTHRNRTFSYTQYLNILRSGCDILL